MATSAAAAAATLPSPSALRLHGDRSIRRRRRFLRLVSPRAILDESKTDLSPKSSVERSESDKLVDKLDFGQLCNEFVCNSSPSVEATARQVVRDILESREKNRALGCYAISAKYKDPVRSFTGREKYKRPLWTTDAFENPKVTIEEMVMLSTSVLNIKWTIAGKAKNLAFLDLIVRVNSRFTMNQISGQVLEHEEEWDPSSSSLLAQSYFWITRRTFSAVEAGKDSLDAVNTTLSSSENESQEMSPDSMMDPTKLFQSDTDFQRDAYQIALFVALLYFLVQFLMIVLE